MACPAPKEEAHRNFAKGGPGSKLAGCLLRQQMERAASHCWGSVSYGVLGFLELGWDLGRRNVGNRFCWKCILQRTGDIETFFYFKCVNTPSSSVSVLLGTSTGKGKAGNT